MFTYKVAIQSPRNEGAVIDALRGGAASGPFERLRAAYAYASAGGALELVRTLRDSVPNWSTLEKRWLISMDWGHTDPQALALLASLDGSQVRVPYAAEVLANGLIPKVCFHPKTIIFDQIAPRRSHPLAIALGSANLTMSGLRTGHEDLALASWTGGRLTNVQRTQLEAMRLEATRFDQVWRTATRLSPAMLAAYQDLRPKSRPRSEDASRRVREIERGLVVDFDKAARLESASRLWIEIRYVVPNLGLARPGNQIDMARGTRVFFGFPATPVPPNTPLGTLSIQFGPAAQPRNMRFGNNSMEKLDLPAPGPGGPPTYENQVLLFTRLRSGVFGLTIGNPAQIAEWKRLSARASSSYRMNSGREWGVLA